MAGQRAGHGRQPHISRSPPSRSTFESVSWYTSADAGRDRPRGGRAADRRGSDSGNSSRTSDIWQHSAIGPTRWPAENTRLHGNSQGEAVISDGIGGAPPWVAANPERVKNDAPLDLIRSSVGTGKTYGRRCQADSHQPDLELVGVLLFADKGAGDRGSWRPASKGWGKREHLRRSSRVEPTSSLHGCFHDEDLYVKNVLGRASISSHATGSRVHRDKNHPHPSARPVTQPVARRAKGWCDFYGHRDERAMNDFRGGVLADVARSRTSPHRVSRRVVPQAKEPGSRWVTASPSTIPDDPRS